MKIDTPFVLIALLIAVLLFISVKGIISSVKNIESIKESKSFQKTMGTITDSSLWFDIEVNKESDDIPIFKTVKTYEYTVNGKKYANNKNQLFDDELLKNFKPLTEVEAYNQWILDSENYKNVIAKLNSEKTDRISVFYDRRNPEISCLQIDIDNYTLLKLGLHILLLVIASVASFFFFKKYF